MPPALAGLRVLVVGLGVSGVAAARLCAACGARVTVNDHRAAEALAAGLAALPPGIDRALGGHPVDVFVAQDLIVLSPGVPALPALAAARAAGVEIIGELELASRFVTAPLVAITGTNGKSTTTTLIGDILAAAGRRPFVGGNLGTPFAEAPGTDAGACVVEVSSFQLETITSFRPLVAVLLNVTPDHLDRYDGLAGYAAAKARIFENQTATDFAVVNVDDPLVDEISRGVRSVRVPLSTRRSLAGEPCGGWLEPDALCLRLPGGEVERLPASLPGLVGRHNAENALAAALAGRLAGATSDDVRRALLAFRPLSHRMELVAEANGVAFFDDSKGTNVGAVVAALDGFPRPVVLIAGGRDKGGSYAPLAQALRPNGRGAVVIGEAAARIEEALAPVLPVDRAATLQDAVALAARRARPGDAVVLSPACSSFDMFDNYAHRAEVFRAAVHAVVASGDVGGRKGQGQP